MKRTILSMALVVVMWGVMSGAVGVKDLENAISAKDTAKVEAILKEDPSLANPKGKKARVDAPIFWALMLGNAETLELLIKNGADVNAPNRLGDTPLGATTTQSAQTLKFVEILLKAGADVNGGGYPLLVMAVRDGKNDLRQLLLKHGAKLDVTAKNGDTVLSMAARAGDLEMVKQSLVAGVDINKKDMVGATALFEAAAQGHLDVVKYLLEKGAKVDIKAQTGSVLYYAAASESRNALEVVKVLIAQKADPNASVPSYGSAMTKAAGGENVKVLEALVEGGGNVNAASGDESWTPLIAAARMSRAENVKYLLGKGADASKKDKNGKTALDYAIKGAGKNAKNDETVKVLEGEAAKRKQKGG